MAGGVNIAITYIDIPSVTLSCMPRVGSKEQQMHLLRNLLPKRRNSYSLANENLIYRIGDLVLQVVPARHLRVTDGLPRRTCNYGHPAPLHGAERI